MIEAIYFIETETYGPKKLTQINQVPVKIAKPKNSSACN